MDTLGTQAPVDLIKKTFGQKDTEIKACNQKDVKTAQVQWNRGLPPY